MTPSLEEFAALLKHAWHRRADLHADASIDCYRIFHGYTEGYPGLSIDRYGDCAIINKKCTLAFEDEDLLAVLAELQPFAQVIMKTHQRIPEATPRRVRYLSGVPEQAPLMVKEEGAYYFADRDSLHTNGFYLDARPARAWLRRNSEERRILNLFAHTGSLGIAARLGGAKEVVYIDKQKAQLQKVVLSYRANKLSLDDRGLLVGDLYFHLPRAIKWGQKFAGIILDPPPVVPPPPKAPKHRPVGQDFAVLIETCCQLLEPDAWVLCIYHSHALSHDEHDQAIVTAAAGRLSPIWRATSGDDFPETNANQRTRMSAFKFT